jgi:hypothetical protein
MREYNLIEGTVMDTNDPQQMGRVKIWCPALDGEEYNIDLLPWAQYMSPFAGQTNGFPAGANGVETEGFHSYGFWAIPKLGARVIVAMLYGDVNQRVYMGSVFSTHANRSLPTGRNRPDLSPTPVSDTFDPVQPQTSHLSVQFAGNLTADEAKTRGAYERAVAEGQDNKTGNEGYQSAVLGEGYDPQTYCLATPGRHALIFQDNPTNGRVRIKTADGNQIIFDDANERIYMSTSFGKSWVEMDADGHIHLYGAASISISAGEDINLSAGGNINILSGGDFNVSAAGHGRISACDDVSISGKGVNIESSSKFNILASAPLFITAPNISMNGAPASKAECADKPSITPNHEPWTRPETKSTRNKNWKK